MYSRLQISNGYNAWILINVAYSLQYSLKDQIKPKHLASRFYFYFFYFIMLQSILHTHFTSSNHYIFLISSEFFFYMLFCKIGSHVWPLKDVGLFSLLHTSSFGSGEQKGDYCENSFNVHVWSKCDNGQTYWQCDF